MHSWQDVTLAVTSFAFNIALIPSVVRHHKPGLPTSAMTAAFQIPILIVYFSYSLWYAFAMVSISTALWITLVVQRYLQIKSKTRT